MIATQIVATIPIGRLHRPERPRAFLELVARQQAQEHRRDVGDVQADDRDRRDREVGDRAVQVRQAEDERADGREPDRVGRRAGPLVDPVPERAARDRAVARERVDHPRVRGDRRHAAEELRADDEEQDEDAARSGRWRRSRSAPAGRPSATSARGCSRRPSCRRPPGTPVSGVIPTFIATRRMKPKITETTTENTMPRGAEVVGVVGLLRHVRRRVVAGERVLGVEQADQRDVQRDAQDQRARGPGWPRSPVLLTVFVNTVPRSVRVCWLSNTHDDDDHGDADDVPPHRHVVEQRDQPDPERVQQRVQDQDHRVDGDRARSASTG